VSVWNPETYLQFEKERTLPCRDLAFRIELDAPTRIADLGCGPGNSTAVLAGRWPKAGIVGIDNSPEMLKIARSSQVRAEWLETDILRWTPEEQFDLIFSNAALQWVPNHEKEIPRLFGLVRRGGALAFQMPTRTDLWFDVLQKLMNSPLWRNQFRPASSDFYSHELPFYYGMLAKASRRIDLWDTKYFHVLPSAEAVVDWTKGTALRPLLDRLSDTSAREAFLRAYTDEIKLAYRKEDDGRILFPFLRRFVIAYR
jgi:trans-aconitate 2-methyltransferase